LEFNGASTVRHNATPPAMNASDAATNATTKNCLILGRVPHADESSDASPTAVRVD
jgi:hypothetical protein